MHVPKRARTIGLAVACVAVGATFGPTLATAAGEKITDVFVTNGDANPVPTKAIGTTEVTGTVGISGTPSVNVANTTPIPVEPVAGPASTPFARHITLAFGGSGPETADQTIFTLPAGKRLTIEFVTFTDLQRLVGMEQFAVQATTNGDFVTHYFAPQDTASNGDTVSQQTSIVADPGTQVRVYAQLTDPLGSDTTTFFMHGSLVGTLTDG
jgi:hypothetical protein